MRQFTLIVGMAVIAVACNQKPSSSENSHKPVPDVLVENLKGKIQQVETETYLIDSTTGKMGKLESKGIEKYNDDGYTISYSNYTAKDSTTTLTTQDIDSNGYFRGNKTTKNEIRSG